LPEELQQALDKRIAIGMAGDLNKYTQYQVANAVPLAAQNEGGVAGVGAGLAAGAVLGQTMAQGLGAVSRAGAPAESASAPAALDAEARLGQLKGLLDKGLISAAEFDSAKAEVLKKLIG
jgi:membrane protease subunit (stomatin/prohibitin family)